MHMILHRLFGHLLRRGEEGPDLHVEADVGEGRGDHLLPAVVAILAHLGDEDCRRAGHRPRGRRQLHAWRGRSCACPAVSRRRFPSPRGSPACGGSRHVRGPARSRRPSPWPAPHRPPRRGDCHCRSAPPRRGAPALSRSRTRSAPCAAAVSFSICRARTAAIVDLQNVDLGILPHRVVVDADHRLLARVDARLGAGCGLFDARLRNACLDGLGHAAHLLDLFDVMPGRAARSAVRRSTK